MNKYINRLLLAHGFTDKIDRLRNIILQAIDGLKITCDIEKQIFALDVVKSFDYHRSDFTDNAPMDETFEIIRRGLIGEQKLNA